MGSTLRSVLIGVVVGGVPLLLLDLARILHDAHQRDGGQTSLWWPIACYVAVGVVFALGAAAGLRDRLVPVVAGVLLLLVTLPTVPSALADWLPAMPIVPSTLLQQAVAFVGVGTFGYVAARGPRS